MTPSLPKSLRFLTACIAFVFGATGCQTFRQAELQTTYLTFSGQQEATLGSQYNQELQKEFQIVDDPVVKSWVEKLGQELIANSPPCDQQFTFNVTTTPEVNAFAIPGGFCYVNAGLIAQADNEAEVAAVVGHEVNHVTKRHGMRSMQRAMGIDLLTQVASADPKTGTAVQLIAGSGGLVAMRSFGREDEREADLYGVEAMYKSGYDPRFAITFFEKLRAGEQSGGSVFARALSTHPATQERIDNIRAQIATYDLSRPMRSDSAEFKEVKKRVMQYAKPAK